MPGVHARPSSRSPTRPEGASCSRTRSFPGDPYVRVANDAQLTGRRIVGIDIPGRRLEVVERFPDRAAYLVRGFHRPGDFLGKIEHDQVPLEVVEGDSVEVTARPDPACRPNRHGVLAHR